MDSKEPAETTGPAAAGADASVQAWRGFTVARLPRILFGAGRSGELGEVVREFGRNALVVTRGAGFIATVDWMRLLVALEAAGVVVSVEAVSGEPSPALVDEIVVRHRVSGASPVDVVVGVGGGSVLDCAKAVAGLLIPGNSVMDHLEGIGPELPYRGPSVPFIAVPTTAGTGSEATKNSVLSVRGPGGFKKSFRDEALVAQVAIVDPDLLGSCPPELIAANGMDALTQLLESYVSLRANPFTDALALSGLACIRDGLLPWFQEAVAGRGADSAGSVAAAGRGVDGAGSVAAAGRGADGPGSVAAAGRGADGPGSVAAAARERMAYAALCSGICLAQAGLGAVHGLASPLGAQFPIPHGVACGATLATATLINIAALETRDPGSVALSRYAVAGWILSGAGGAGDPEARAALITALEQLTALLNVPRLSAYGITAASIPALVADSRGSSMKTNPIVLTDEEVGAVLLASL